MRHVLTQHSIIPIFQTGTYDRVRRPMIPSTQHSIVPKGSVMSIIIDKKTRVVVQGITGNEGLFHTRQMVEYGTKIVGGVTPGKGGQAVDGIPVFNTVASAVKETGANASIIFVPPAFSADAVMEAADAGLRTIVCITEGIPTFDMIQVKHYLKGKNVPPHWSQQPRNHIPRKM